MPIFRLASEIILELLRINNSNMANNLCYLLLHMYSFSPNSAKVLILVLILKLSVLSTYIDLKIKCPLHIYASHGS